MQIPTSLQLFLRAKPSPGHGAARHGQPQHFISSRSENGGQRARPGEGPEPPGGPQREEYHLVPAGRLSDCLGEGRGRVCVLPGGDLQGDAGVWAGGELRAPAPPVGEGAPPAALQRSLGL